MTQNECDEIFVKLIPSSIFNHPETTKKIKIEK
jgi:hypothetical protein